MTRLTHPWIRELYAVALDPRYDDFARQAMWRSAATFGCDAMVWRAGGEQRCISFRAHIPESKLATLDIGAQDLGQRMASLAVSVRTSAQQQIQHVVAFIRDGTTFSVDDETELQGVAEHLAGADLVAREYARRSEPSRETRTDPQVGEATVTADGRILVADARCRELLRSIDAAASRDLLPFPLIVNDLVLERGMVVQGVHVRVQRSGEHFVLRLRRDRRAAVLSLREIEIAERVALGMTFKEIARALNLAQSTVSTHVYNTYGKLGIRRRSDLVQWLSASASATVD
jgi:DNA-binding CsgD family transcriptional regulator